MSNSINASIFKKMFLSGAHSLEAKKEWINELNVFPVPDGDTGTNMTMTIMSAANEVLKADDNDMKAITKAISSGSLRGARGNSGVILSQLLRGLCKVAGETEEMDIPTIARACEKACESAYKAVMKPKEGTILTVAKGMADKAKELADDGCEDLEVFIDEIIKKGDEVLAYTPELLPVLKQAGVVDSGGQGLMEVVKGFRDAFLGKEIDYSSFNTTVSKSSAPRAASEYKNEISAEDIKFGYCTEFIIMLNKPFNVKHEKDFKAYLESIGDSINCVADDDIVKIHVHTNDPGMAIQRALLYGQLSDIKIDNMRLEHQETLFNGDSEESKEEPVEVAVEETPHKDNAFIAVAAGEGLDSILKDIGVDIVISGGQTMNPSTEDFVEAAGKLNADHIYIFPNNKNIVLAANQATYLVEGKDVHVIPTKTIPQGITAMLSFDASASAEDNVTAMTDIISTVSTGEVTYAVRDTTIDDKEIKSGDYMGIGDKGILSVCSDLDETVISMVDEMMDDDKELISIYYGADVDEDAAESIRSLIEEKYPSCDVELQMGGQPVYYYIISAE